MLWRWSRLAGCCFISSCDGEMIIQNGMLVCPQEMHSVVVRRAAQCPLSNDACTMTMAPSRYYLWTFKCQLDEWRCEKHGSLVDCLCRRQYRWQRGRGDVPGSTSSCGFWRNWLSWRRLMNLSCCVGVSGSSSGVSESRPDFWSERWRDGRANEGRTWARERKRNRDGQRKRGVGNKRINPLDNCCPSNRLVMAGWLVAGMEAGWQKYEKRGAEQHLSQAPARAALLVHTLSGRILPLFRPTLSTIHSFRLSATWVTYLEKKIHFSRHYY